MAPLRAWFCLLLLLTGAFAAGCLEAPPRADVLTSVYPLTFVAERIAGGNVTVAQLAPEGHAAHDWEPSARDLARITDSHLLLVSGRGLEEWLPSVRGALGDTAPPIIVTTDGLGGAASDPHTWLDPVLFAEQVDAVRAALATAFPGHAAAFQARSDALIADLATLHDGYAAALADCTHDRFVTEHAAFGLLADRYGLHNHAVAGLDPEAEPSARRVQEVIDIVRTHGIQVVFREPDTHGNIMQQIADETGATVRVLHPIEGRTAADRAAGADLLDLMAQNRDALASALECDG